MRALVEIKKPDGVQSSQAMRIVEKLATTTGTALLKADFQSFSNSFLFPHYVMTQSGERVVRTVDELRVTFDHVIRHYRLSGVDRMERYCVYGSFIDDNTIACAHESRLFRNDILVQQPFQAHSNLKHESGVWKIYSSEYSISDSLRYVRALTG